MIQFNVSGLFKLFMIGIGVVGFILATTYTADAAIIPMWLSIFLVVIMILLFLQENVPAFSKYLSFMGQSGLFSQEKTKTEKPERKEEVLEENQEYRKLFRMVIWLVAITILLKFVTYLIAVPVFLLLFIRFEGGQSWKSAVYVAAGMGIFNFVLFDILLKSSF